MNGDIVFYIFLILTVITIIIFAYIYNMGNKKTENNNAKFSGKGDGQIIDEKNLIDKSKLQDLLEIEDIDDNNVIHLKRGNGLRVVFAISTPDIYLLNEDEQHVFENALLNLSLSLNFPIQFLTTTRKIETKKSSEKLLDTINSTDERISDNLREYSELLYGQLVAIEQNRKVNEIKNYCIVGVSNLFDDKRARSELSARIEAVVKGFTTAKIKTDLLEKEKVLQLLCDMLNRGDNIPINQFMSSEAFSSRYTTGESLNAGGGYNGV